MQRAGVLLCALLCLLCCVAPWNAEAKAGGKKRRAATLSASYIRMRNRWHARPPKALQRAYLQQSPWPALVLAPVGDAPRQLLMPSSEHGGFDAAALEQAATALADKHSKATHSIEPRLLDLVYAATRHFSAPFVHVISGYREEVGESRHAQGRAIDIVLPGVSDKQLAAHLRKQGFVGVGIYHRAGFVHLDVRARSYFWSDNSAPSERSRPRPILKRTAEHYDALARKRGVVPLVDRSDAPEVEAPSE